MMYSKKWCILQGWGEGSVEQVRRPKLSLKNTHKAILGKGLCNPYGGRQENPQRQITGQLAWHTQWQTREPYLKTRWNVKTNTKGVHLHTWATASLASACTWVNTWGGGVKKQNYCWPYRFGFQLVFLVTLPSNPRVIGIYPHGKVVKSAFPSYLSQNPNHFP